MTKLKIYYDTDIAELKYNGNYLFESGKEYSFDNTSYMKLFTYKPKSGTFSYGAVNAWWGTNKYFANGDFDSSSYSFSESNVITAYNTIHTQGAIEPFLCLTSPRFSVNGVLNTKRPLIICGDYVSKQVVNNGDTDTITVTFSPNLYLTNVKLYYRDSSNSGKYEDYNTGISTDKHTFTATVPHLTIENSYSTKNDYSYIVVPTLTDQAPVTPVEPTIDLNVTYNNGVSNITDSFSGQKAGTVTGTVTAGAGYNISTVTGAYIKDKYGYKTNIINFVSTKIKDNQYSYSFTLTSDNITALNKNDKTVYLTVTVAKIPNVEPTINLNVTYNNGLTNITDSFSGQKAGTVTGTVTAGLGYSITSCTGAFYKDKYGYTTNLSNFNSTKISDYKYSYSFTLTDSNINALNNLDKTVHLNVKVQKEPGNINIDSTNLEHCSISPSTITQGNETILTLNADSGYILNGTGSYSVDGKTNNFTCNNVSSYQITVTAETSVSISFVATKVETKPGSIVHTYILDQEDYNNLGKQIITGVNSTATGFEQYDYTKFVNYLYEIPFKVGNDITTSTNTINLGKKNLNIDCQKVTHETLNIDLGSIDLTSITNSHDYKPINITLYCPFINNIVLPVTVLGSKLKLKFTINLKSEEATLLITQNNNVIYSGQTELFTDLPLYFTAGLQDTLIKQFKTQYQNTIKQAYIIVNYNKPITNLTSYKTTEHGKLSNYKGFTRISRGTLKQSISSSIDNSILSLLAQGVIIK